jgi:secreted trypsin-like serine protease
VLVIGVVSKGDSKCDDVAPTIFTRITTYMDDFVKKHVEDTDDD